jgi:hypothetical protein
MLSPFLVFSFILGKKNRGLWDHLSFCLSVNSANIAQQRLGKPVPVAKNTHATIEEFFGSVVFFAVRVVSKENRQLIISRTSYVYYEIT